MLGKQVKNLLKLCFHEITALNSFIQDGFSVKNA